MCDFDIEYLDEEYYDQINYEINNSANDVVVDKIDAPKQKRKHTSVNANKNKKQKNNEFSADEKKKLCALIEKHRCIWDLQEKLHKNAHAIASSWKDIAANMSKSGKYKCITALLFEPLTCAGADNFS